MLFDEAIRCFRQPEPRSKEQLGRNVLQAAEGEAMRATWLLRRIGFAADGWPRRFVCGIAAECVVNDSEVQSALVGVELGLDELQGAGVLVDDPHLGLVEALGEPGLDLDRDLQLAALAGQVGEDLLLEPGQLAGVERELFTW